MNKKRETPSSDHSRDGSVAVDEIVKQLEALLAKARQGDVQQLVLVWRTATEIKNCRVSTALDALAMLEIAQFQTLQTIIRGGV